MSYKPTKEELIDYLYGEMKEEIRVKMEQYLETHPEAQQELETLQGAQMALNQWNDEEVPEPLHLTTQQKLSEWHYWRKFVAIAAILLIIMAFGWASGFQISYSDASFRAGFGTHQESMSEEEIQGLLAANKEEILRQLNTSINATRNNLDDQVHTIRATLINKIDQLESATLSEEETYLAINHQKQELVAQMVQLNQRLVADYREIFNQLIVNFSDNWENRRIEDLREIQAAIVNLEDATANRQDEIEEALFNLSQEINMVQGR